MRLSGKMPNYACDLHCHTTRSDGADSPQELVDHAVAAKMKVIAITDHDTKPPDRITVGGIEKDIRKYAWEKGLTLLRGIEISCETQVEDVHLVCLGCAWEAAFFSILEEDVIASKVESYRLLVERLAEDGAMVSWEEILANNGKPITERQIQKKQIFEHMAAKGCADSWQAAKLLVKKTPRYSILRRKPDPAGVIGKVHEAGGIAILAHPYLIASSFILNERETTRGAYIEGLIEAGLDGIEARYTYDKTSYAGRLSKEEIEREIRVQYGGRLSVLSGGSDYHADAKKGVENARFIGECGITEEELSANPVLRRLLQ